MTQNPKLYRTKITDAVQLLRKRNNGQIVGFVDKQGVEHEVKVPVVDSLADVPAGAVGPVFTADGKQHFIGATSQNIQRRLWPVQAHNFITMGSDDLDGECSYLFSSTLQRLDLSTGIWTTVFDRATLLDEAGNALGANVGVRHVMRADENTLLMELRRSDSTPANKAYLFRSIDDGANWGNNATADNKKPSLLLGHDGTTHRAPISTIAGNALQRITLGNRQAIAFIWYNTESNNNNPIGFQISYDAGFSWQTVWLSSTLSRHAHLVRQDPITGHIWFGFGDSDAQSGIIKWDGISSWPDGDFTYADLEGRSGFQVWHGSRKFRPLAFWFHGGYVYWTSDNGSSAGAENRGIFRNRVNGIDGSTEQVSTINAEKPNTSGGYGIESKSGAWYAIEFPESTETGLTKDIYASFDKGQTWKLLGHFELASDPSQTLSIGLAGDRIWISHPTFAGSSTMRTYLYDEVIDEMEFPDQLAPCCWVDANNANALDSTANVVAFNNKPQGLFPEHPYLSVKYALEGSRSTYGHRVLVGAASYESALITVAWNSYTSTPGPEGRPVHVSPASPGLRYELIAEAAATRLFQFPTSSMSAHIESANLETANAAGNIYDTSTTSFLGTVNFIDCRANMTGVSTTNLFIPRGGWLRFIRSLINSDATTGVLVYARNTMAAPVEILSSVLKGGQYGVLSDVTAHNYSAIVENSIIESDRQCIRNETSGNKPFKVKNSFLYTEHGAGPVYHAPALTYNNEIDYCVIYDPANNTGVDGVINANGQAYSADMFKMRSLFDYAPGVNLLFNAGDVIEHGFGIDFTGKRSNAAYIGVVAP